MLTTDGELSTFAAAAGIELVRPAEQSASSTGDFREDPSLDYGRVVRRTPLAVLRPRDQAQLGETMRFLREARIAYKIRGAAHSSGGQVLIEGGVVLDLRRLDRIVADDPDRETITVEGGAWWLALIHHLRGQERRPRALTANVRASVAGTLAVGGFGDSSHLYGLQISHVKRLALITPDGQRRELGPDDELFRWSLAGRGQLGVIAEATLQTVRKPLCIAVRRLGWDSLADFVRDSMIMTEYHLYDFVRARLHFPPDGGEPRVDALVGRTAFGMVPSEPAIAPISPARRSHLDLLDLHHLLTRDQSEDWRLPCPALEFVLPLPDGLDAWRELAPMIAAAGIPPLQPRGHAVMVVRADPRFPLAPTSTGSRECVMIALRPELPVDEALALLPALRAIGRRALELGGRMYLMSIELDDPLFLERQFGSALARFRALKAELDPLGLLNPGLL